METIASSQSDQENELKGCSITGYLHCLCVIKDVLHVSACSQVEVQGLERLFSIVKSNDAGCFGKVTFTVPVQSTTGFVRRRRLFVLPSGIVSRLSSVRGGGETAE